MADGIGVVVVNYHSSELVFNCLRTLSSSTIRRIVIVDNSDDHNERVRLRAMSEADPRVAVIDPGENLGFAKACNVGASECEDAVEYLWFLNPDTEAVPDAPEILVESLRSGKTDLVSPLLTTGVDKDRVWFAGGHFDRRAGVTWHWHAGERVDQLAGTWAAAPLSAGTSLIPSSFITGAAPMLASSTWQQLGGFPDDLFLYWEDAAMSLQAQTLGLQMHVDGRAHVWHAQGGSTGDRDGGHSALYYYYGQRNRVLVCTASGTPLRVLLLGRGSRETLRLLIAPLVVERSSRVAKVVASAMGIIDGVRGIHGRARY